MNYSFLEVEGGCAEERNSFVVLPSVKQSDLVKRQLAMLNRDGLEYVIKDTPPKETRSEDGKIRKQKKKFRIEWMDEDHLKDWLQPYPGDETMCICTACDIVLRCGKSELEKHATGLKHTKKVQEMKIDSSHQTEDSHTQAQANAQAARLEHLFNRNDEQIWIPVTSNTELPMEDEDEELLEEDEAIQFIRPQQKEKTSSDAKLTEALVKLFEFADGKADLSRKRLEMLQEEHALKLQILEKELRLKTLEVEIKETQLKKLKLESMQSCVKESPIQQNSQLTINDHQLHVISDQHLQEALQAQLQHLQSQFEHHQSHEPKVNGSLT